MRATFFGIAVLLLGTLPVAAQSQEMPSSPGTVGEPTPLGAATSTSSKDETSFGSLFTNLGHDFARLPSKQNLVTLGVGGALALAVHPAEHELTARASSSDPLEDVFEGGGIAGGAWVQIGGALGTYAIGRTVGNRQVQLIGADLVRAQIFNSILTHSIKFAVHRTRPDQGLFSFPSGHASATFATATVLQRHFGWRVSLPAYGLATYVAASRLPENRHFASDVIFGAAIGMVAGRTVTVGRGAGRFIVSPVIVPGGAGVAIEHAP